MVTIKPTIRSPSTSSVPIKGQAGSWEFHCVNLNYPHIYLHNVVRRRHVKVNIIVAEIGTQMAAPGLTGGKLRGLLLGWGKAEGNRNHRGSNKTP